MDTRVRFAPSPTGQVHIGNIRTAIFNWLFARHTKGRFLLRIEDTDLERSTEAATKALLECMEWLGLDYDEEILYQSKLSDDHRKAAEGFMAKGLAYRPVSTNGQPPPIIFSIPWDTSNIPAVRTVGPAEIELNSESPVKIEQGGVSFAQTTKKGTPLERSACLAGFLDLRVIDTSGNCVFELNKEIGPILEGKASFSFDSCSKLCFTRREVFYKDIIKGELAKPLDSMKDLVILRGDGSPIFHLANVCDDITQKITHIIRGDDHVENTYKHIFLFYALGHAPPAYGHMPMIVNQSGKPYSKRDGDAFVGDFREKGYYAEAFFNYLSLLGWSPGDDREKLSRKELIELFQVERVKSAPAQFDLNKLFNMNGLYLAELPPNLFTALAWQFASRCEWAPGIDSKFFEKVAALMQSRTKLLSHTNSWQYFFTDKFEYDMKSVQKLLSPAPVRGALATLCERCLALEAFNETSIEAEIRKVEAEAGIASGKLNQPLRVAVTG
ncbi:MAG: hypothetical protein A2X49_11290, partial [Lentisphaerae bacterium GWF2_52_8]